MLSLHLDLHLSACRAHQRCCHVAQWGNFPSLSLGSERGLRCYTTGGEQVRLHAACSYTALHADVNCLEDGISRSCQTLAGLCADLACITRPAAQSVPFTGSIFVAVRTVLWLTCNCMSHVPVPTGA